MKPSEREGRRHASARVAGAMGTALAVGLTAFAGCGPALRSQVDQLRSDYPYLLAPLAVSGRLDEPQANRCGPNGLLTDLIPDCPMDDICFSHACLDHDLCYSTCGASEQICDGTFFWNLVYMCDIAPVDEAARTRCYSVAWIYYAAVDLFGESFFAVTQDIVCNLPNRATGTNRDADAPPPPVAPFVDEDGDLLPDDWEIENMLDPANSKDVWLDLDGDGLVNLTEYIRNTDPYSASVEVGSSASH